MSEETLRRLRTMADQIARNFAVLGKDRAIAATADHITKFWEPRMKAAILADDRSQLGQVAAAAIDRLAAERVRNAG